MSCMPWGLKLLSNDDAILIIYWYIKRSNVDEQKGVEVRLGTLGDSRERRTGDTTG